VPVARCIFFHRLPSDWMIDRFEILNVDDGTRVSPGVTNIH
jgi:hypothetical protein